jgi:hypothetical protein
LGQESLGSASVVRESQTKESARPSALITHQDAIRRMARQSTRRVCTRCVLHPGCTQFSSPCRPPVPLK